jgi:peptidoglycan/LPS O-acetylase OafA/YrhL
VNILSSSLLEKLSRVTSSQKFIPEVDGLRFIAIFTVVLYHLRTSVLRFGDFNEELFKSDLFFTLLSNGGLGVNVFFTISGFILGLPFLRDFLYGTQRVSIRKYFVRRVSRLEPPYIIIMTLFFMLQVLALSLSFQELMPHFTASLLYGHFFIFGTWSVINPVAWSLETEVQFYLLAPLIAFIFKIRSVALRLFLYTGIIGLHLFVLANFTSVLIDWHLVKSIAYYFTNFFLGFVLADLFLMKSFQVRHKHWGFDLVGLLSLALLFYSYFKPGTLDMIIFCISTVGLFIATFKGVLFNRMLTNRIVTTIGGMCYTIYLIHYVFLFSVLKLFGDFLFSFDFGFYISFFLCFIVLIPALLLLSAVFFYCFERPFMYPDWYRRWTFGAKAV